MVNIKYLEKISEYHYFDVLVLFKYDKIVFVFKKGNIEISGCEFRSPYPVNETQITNFFQCMISEFYYHFVLNMAIKPEEFRYVWSIVTTKLNQKIRDEIIENHNHYLMRDNIRYEEIIFIPSYDEVLKFCYPQIVYNKRGIIKMSVTDYISDTFRCTVFDFKF